MKWLKINKAWWAVLLIAFSVLLPVLSLAVPEKAEALGPYRYSDASYSSIIGPPIYKGLDPQSEVSFKKVSGDTYEITNDNISGIPCQTTRIKVSTDKKTGKLFSTDCGRDTGGKDVNHGQVDISFYAIKNGYWLDHSHITINGYGIYEDGKIDDTVTFSVTDAKDSCSQKNNIDGFPHSGSGGDGKNTANASAKVKLHSFAQSTTTGNSTCLESILPLKMNDPNHNYNRYFTWQDSGTISTSDQSTMVFQLQQGTTGKGNFLGKKDGSCQSYITADPDNPNSGKLVIQSNGSNPFHSGFPDGSGGDTSGQHIGDAKLTKVSGCNVSKPISIYIANPKDPKSNKLNSTLEAGTASVGADSASGDSSAPALKCDFGLGSGIFADVTHIFNPLNWLLCGIVKGMSLIVDTLDSAINSELAVGTDGSGTSTDPTNIFTGDDGSCTSGNACDAYYSAWASFRNIALGLMVIAVLIVIIAQVIGMEILDAYTIRKVLPRMLIAAIGITLSWQLMRFFVTLTNDLGYGIRYLIYHPFATAGFDEIRVKGLGGGTGIGLGIIAGIGLAFFDFIGILAFVGTAAIAVFVAFITLVLRQILITLLIILAPIAIVAYILPNTQRVYKFWWESFSKALLMFPMIVAMIAAGRVFAMLALTGPNSHTLLSQIIAFVAYFGPYMMIPLTFRFAGSAMGGIGNFVNSRGQGAAGALQKFRSGRVQKNSAALKGGTRWEGKSWLKGSQTAADLANFGSSSLGSGWNGRFGFGSRGQRTRRIAINAAARQLERDEGMQNIAGKNNVTRALAFGNGSEQEARDHLMKHLTKDGGDDGKTYLSEAEAAIQTDQAILDAKAAGGFTKAHAVAAFKMMHRDGTAIRDQKDAATLAARVGDGDAIDTYTYAAEGAGISRQAGRSDLASASEPAGAYALAMSQSMFGNGVYNRGDPSRERAQADLAALDYDAWESGAGGESMWQLMNNGKGRTVENIMTHASTIMKDTNGTYTDAQKFKAAKILREGEMAREQGHGRQNNRDRAGAVLDNPTNKAAYEAYMNETIPGSAGSPPAGPPIPGQAPISQGTKRGQLVSKEVGDRIGSMTEDQRRAMENSGHNEQQNNEEENK